jgi:hypothetical protein
MRKEQYITFETAKLAKEKGFDEPCNRYYEDGFIHENRFFLLNNNSKIMSKTSCSAPTQSLLARWLRETYKIIVTVPFNYDTKLFTYFIGNYEHPISKSTKEYSTYEEAFETGLQEALKQIESEGTK